MTFSCSKKKKKELCLTRVQAGVTSITVSVWVFCIFKIPHEWLLTHVDVWRLSNGFGENGSDLIYNIVKNLLNWCSIVQRIVRTQGLFNFIRLDWSCEVKLQLSKQLRREINWQQRAFFFPQQQTRLTEASLWSSLSSSYWCFVADGTFDGPLADYCVYRASKLGVRLSHYILQEGKILYTQPGLCWDNRDNNQQCSRQTKMSVWWQRSDWKKMFLRCS